MRILPLVVVVACTHAADRTMQPPPPYQMTLDIEAIHAVAPSTVTITGANPGASVALVGSTTGLGTTAPVPLLGGLSADVQPPWVFSGPYTADAAGAVVVQVPKLGLNTLGETLYVQAAVPDGAGSYLSNPVAVRVTAAPAGPGLDRDGDGDRRFPWGTDLDDDGDGAETYFLGGTDHADTDAARTLDGGTGTFGPLEEAFIGRRASPTGIAIGDFDNDGAPDVVTSNQDNDTSTVFSNDGTGVLAFEDSFDVPRGFGGGDVAVGDFNRDGHLDYIARNVYLGDGGFRFVEAGRPDGYNTNHGDLEVFDANGDGILDLGAADYGNGATLWLGHGDGTFGAPTSIASSACYNATWGHLDDDGTPDLVLGCGTTGIEIWLSGGGTYTQVDSEPGSGIFVSDVELADFDGDGDLDLVSAGAIPGFTGSSAVHLNDGTGQMTLGSTQAYPEDVERFALADYDGDGAVDLLVSSQSSGSWFAFGNGDGTFGTPALTGFDARNFDLDAADMNGDGILDQVGISIDRHTVGIALGQ
jgi:hypothetical protein